MKDELYAPAAVFRLFCAYMRRKSAYVKFPALFKNMYLETKENKETLGQLLDLKGKQNRYHRVSSITKDTATGEERYKVDGHLQSMLRKEDLYLDVLPYVFRMIHPNVRDVNTSLFNKDEHMSFRLAIEIMVTLDIKLKREGLIEGNDVP